MVLHPNLVFGDYSYLIRYMTQSVLAGKIDKSFANPEDRVNYLPVHLEDVAQAVSHALDNFDSVKGHKFSVKGSEEVTLAQITDLIKAAANKDKVAFTNNFGVGNFVSEFMYGLSHDKNMTLMAEHFAKNFWEFTHDNDYFTSKGLTPEHKITEFFEGKELREEDFVYPLFSGYKKPELD